MTAATFNMLVCLADRVCPKIKETIKDYGLRMTYSDSVYCILEGHFLIIRILFEANGTYTVKMNGHSHKELELEDLNDLITTEIQVP